VSGPLRSLTVLDLTQHVAGPYAAKLLGLYGARVIKVERPRVGDCMRREGPFVGDVPGENRSLAFLDLNVNKLGITLDLSQPRGREILLELVRRADVVLESFRPGTLERWHLGYDVLREAQPRIVLTSITNFGQDGPYRDLLASEIVLFAMGGAMYATGTDEPLMLAPRVQLHYAGLVAATATLGALMGRRLHGRGEHVDISIFEALAASVDRRADALVAYAYCGEKTERARNPTQAFPPVYSRCRDGYVVIHLPYIAWPKLAAALQAPWLRDLKPAQLAPGTPERAEVERLWTQWCESRDRATITETLQAVGIACAPVNWPADLFTVPQLTARGFFRTVHHPEVGPALYAGLPFLMRREQPPGPSTPAPRLGEHNEQVYGELGLSRQELRALAEQGVI